MENMERMRRWGFRNNNFLGNVEDIPKVEY